MRLLRAGRDSISCIFFFSSRRRHTRYWRDWSSDVCSSDLVAVARPCSGACSCGADVTGVSPCCGSSSTGAGRVVTGGSDPSDPPDPPDPSGGPGIWGSPGTVGSDGRDGSQGSEGREGSDGSEGRAGSEGNDDTGGTCACTCPSPSVTDRTTCP